MTDRHMGAADGHGPDGTAATLALGVLAGALGVWALDRLDWAMWNSEAPETRQETKAVRPGGEPPAQVIVTRTTEALGTELSPTTHEAVSQLVHYSIGVAPAIAYAFARQHLGGPSLTRGALFGAGLWAMQDEGLNTIAGLGADPRDYPWQDHARGLVAHTFFGMAVEAVLAFADEGRRATAR